LRISGLLLLFLCGEAVAAVLPEERADLLYHSYDGGGAEIDGPSVLLRKNLGSSVSLGLNHYVDNVTSASIDVVVTASEYTEKREENTVAFDYLRQKSTMSVAYTRSEESDFDATTLSLGISQDMFGDLTTVGIGFSLGDNVITQNGNDNFEEDATVRSYRIDLSQIFTRNLVMAFSFETITDEGYLNNPYRSVRYVDPGGETGYSFQPEVYPETRTSNALAVRANYYLAPRSALHAGLRLFEDSWDIGATTYELGYTLPYKENWIFATRLSLYDQSSADFYSDLFPFQDAQNYLARDKELSSFSSTTIGVSATYQFGRAWKAIERGSLNLELDWIRFEYDDFRDLTESGDVGEEPLYSFDAQVIRFFMSLWF
jgi:hypothetical protein